MLIGYNTIRYFEDKSIRRWENADNKFIYVSFKTNKIPPFVLISDTEETTATVQIFDANTDDPIGAEKDVAVTTVNSGEAYEAKQLKFDGFDLTGMDEGCYYSRIEVGNEVAFYYSEVFAWTEDSTANLKENGMLKITATSANIRMGNRYPIDLTDITYECFFEVQDPDEEPATKEKGAEKPEGDIPTFNTRVLKPSFNFLGNYDMLEFLSGLRELMTNGTVIFTWNGISRTGLDIIFELEETHSDQEAISGSLKYTRDDYISSSNAT